MSSPAVVNGVAYVGSEDGKLYALDAGGNTNCSGTPKTCAPLWTASTGGTIYSSPTVANGIVYIGSEDESLCLRRGGEHQLLGHTEDVCSAVDRTHRRQCLLVRGRLQRRRLRGLARWQLIRLRCGGDYELLGYAEDMRSVVDLPYGFGVVVPSGSQRHRLCRGLSLDGLWLRRSREDELLWYTQGVRTTLDQRRQQHHRHRLVSCSGRRNCLHG